MRLIDLFAGIGGFSYAAHQLGWETVQFVERDKFCKSILRKNFPTVPIHGDINTYRGSLHSADIITGGFPCQPFSTAGKRKGKTDSRYLWPAMLRIVREVQPVAVVGENVGGIYTMEHGHIFERVCTDLESEGYQVQPFRIPACATGAPHRRDRWWFVGYSESIRSHGLWKTHGGSPQQAGGPNQQPAAHPTGRQSNGPVHPWGGWDGLTDADLLHDLTNPHGPRQEWSQRTGAPAGRQGQGDTCQSAAQRHQTAGHSPGKRRETERQGQASGRAWTQWDTIGGGNWTIPWPQIATWLCRVDDGLPSWLDGSRTNRLKALGNSIQPQVALPILKAIHDHIHQIHQS